MASAGGWRLAQAGGEKPGCQPAHGMALAWRSSQLNISQYV